MWNLKYEINEPVLKKKNKIETESQNRLEVAKEGRAGGRVEWKVGVSRCTAQRTIFKIL